MRFFLQTLVLLCIVGFTSLRLAAQEADSAWIIEWERYVEEPDGTKDTAVIPLTMWLEGEYGRLIVNDDRYITLNRDSVFVMDMYEKLYTGGLIKNRDLIHLMKLDIARHRNVAPPMVIQETRVTETLMGYETNLLLVDLVANKLYTPLKQQLFVTNQLPLQKPLLRTMYNATGFVDSDISIDYFALGDTLTNRGLVSLLSKVRVNLPVNKAGWLVTELVNIKRVPVASGFFRPPSDYKYYQLVMPTEEEVWMARGMKMPGGPREERSQEHGSMK